MTAISIRQPLYLPYLGFFKKIQSSDVFVFLDDVKYSRGDFENRNKIRTNDGFMWLTVPILNSTGVKLNEAKIASNSEWNKKHIKSIEYNYSKTPYFYDYWDDIKEILKQKWEKLIDLNMILIEYFLKILNIDKKIIFSSSLDTKFEKSERILEICKKLDATRYISGEKGINYLDTSLLENEGIKVIFEKFKHPTYRQIHGKFVSNMSIIDLLFNEGPNSGKILEESTNLT